MKNIYKKGGIVLVHFPFTNGVDSKVRPGMIVRDQHDDDVTILPISTRIRLKKEDILIPKAAYVGQKLMVESAIRISKITTIDQGLILKKVTSLKKEFLSKVEWGLMRYLDLK